MYFDLLSFLMLPIGQSGCWAPSLDSSMPCIPPRRRHDHHVTTPVLRDVHTVATPFTAKKVLQQQAENTSLPIQLSFPSRSIYNTLAVSGIKRWALLRLALPLLYFRQGPPQLSTKSTSRNNRKASTAHRKVASSTFAFAPSNYAFRFRLSETGLLLWGDEE